MGVFCFQIFKSRMQTGIQTSHWRRCHKIWVTMIKFILVSVFLLDLSWLFLLLFAHSFYPKMKEWKKFKVWDRCEVWEKHWNLISHDGEEGLGKKRNAVWSAGWGLSHCSMGVLLSTSLGPSVTTSLAHFRRKKPLLFFHVPSFIVSLPSKNFGTIQKYILQFYFPLRVTQNIKKQWQDYGRSHLLWTVLPFIVHIIVCVDTIVFSMFIK